MPLQATGALGKKFRHGLVHLLKSVPGQREQCLRGKLLRSLSRIAILPPKQKPFKTVPQPKFFFPTLAVGLLDFKVNVVLARLEADLSDQPSSIPAVPNRQVSLQCPTAKYPCSAQPQNILTLPNRKVSLQCSTAKYPCSAQPKASLQCPTAEYPWSAQQQSSNILAAHLQCCKEDS